MVTIPLHKNHDISQSRSFGLKFHGHFYLFTLYLSMASNKKFEKKTFMIFNDNFTPLYTQTLREPYKNQNSLSPHISYSLNIKLLERRREEVIAQIEHCLMLNLAIENKANKDTNHNKSTITQPKMGIMVWFL